MADKYGRQEGVSVDPDLAVFANRANLHADFVCMADDHHFEHVIATRVGVQHYASIAFKLMQMPAAGCEAFKVGLQYAVGHGAFQAYRARGGKNVAHDVELRVGHGLRPGFGAVAHVKHSPLGGVYRLLVCQILASDVHGWFAE